MERELSALGPASKGMNDVFRHCRGFERAYTLALDEPNVAFKVRAVVEGNLPEALHRIPIEKRFNRLYVREICREADGYQPHIVSPERGIRRLVAEAMRLTRDHVHRFVDEIHLVLLETVRECARKSVAAEAGAINLDYLRLRGFENAVIVAAQQALEDWRSEAHRVAEMMVQMECDYITPSAFRELERQYQESAMIGDGNAEMEPVHQNDPLARLAAGNVVNAPPNADGEDYDSDAEGSTNDPMASPTSSGAMPSPRMPIGRDDLKAGYLEKRVGEGSNLSAMPVDSWRWQRRWFVLAMEPGFLYYFKSHQEMMEKQATQRNTINLRECIVEDFQPEAGNQRAARRSTQRLPENAGSVSLLIRISHRNPNRPVYKDHPQIILRAQDAADKYDWLARLRNATEPSGGAGKAPKITGTSAQYSMERLKTTPSEEQRGLFGRTVDKVTDKFQKFGGFGGSRLGNVMQVGSIEDMEAYYERLGNFCGIYAREVFNRMAKTVPKAIILCQVIRSRDRLLDQLYDYISSLKPVEIDALLQEDPILIKRRNGATQASKDLGDAQAEVRRAQELRATSASPRETPVPVSVRALLLAGAYPLVPKNVVPPSIDLRKMYGDGTPLALAIDGAPPALGPPQSKSAENGTSAPSAVAAPREGASPVAATTPEDKASAPGKPRRQPPPPPKA